MKTVLVRVISEVKFCSYESCVKPAVTDSHQGSTASDEYT